MADQSQASNPEIGVADPGKVGATVRPIYGERRPVMYHLFESEMKSISGFNGVALGCFSVGSFFLNSAVAILIDWGFSGQVSEQGNLMIHKVIFAVSILSIVFFVFGGYALWSRRSVVKQIKKETVSNENALRSNQ
ncbi:MAG: hypothetical protein WAN65_01150 [Candidatus Sulfotelmatobacter sp.]